MSNHYKPSRIAGLFALNRDMTGSSGAHWLLGGILLAITLLGVLPAEARLGNTFLQCSKLYGTPTGTTEIPGLIPNGVGFHRGEYSITCGFRDNRCVIMVIMRMAPNDPAIRDMPRGDMSLFMTDSFGHTSWTHTRFDSRGSYWRTYDLADRKLYYASYSNSLKMLTLRVEES